VCACVCVCVCVCTAPGSAMGALYVCVLTIILKGKSVFVTHTRALQNTHALKRGKKTKRVRVGVLRQRLICHTRARAHTHTHTRPAKLTCHSNKTG
jgi:hypothetical protein